MNPDDLAEAARILDAVADEVEAGVIEANIRDSRYLRGAAAGLRAASDQGPARARLAGSGVETYLRRRGGVGNSTRAAREDGRR